jgi:hypothetical protein
MYNFAAVTSHTGMGVRARAAAAALPDGLEVVARAGDPDLVARALDFPGRVWPAYRLEGSALETNRSAISEAYPEAHFVLYNRAADTVLAQTLAVPLAWDGRPEGLPASMDALVEGALSRAPERRTALVPLVLEMNPDATGRGLSRTVIQAQRTMARALGMRWVVVPMRPVWKDRYPLTPIEAYVRWRRDDGEPIDPWWRIHRRLGAKLERPAPESLRVAASVADWERWTELALPESGPYVFRRGMAPLMVDREEGVAVHFEPHHWISHDLGEGQ